MMNYTRVGWCVLLFLLSCNREEAVKRNGLQEPFVQVPGVYEWRGENRSGSYEGHGLLKSWPEGGPGLVWEYEGIGNGFGAPVLTPDRIYVLGETDSLAHLFAFDSAGNFLWKQAFGKEWINEYGGSRSTPTVAGNLIYVTSGTGSLCCLDRDSGKIRWSVDLFRDLQGPAPSFGYVESVVVDAEKVYCIPGGRASSVMALDRFTGEVAWTSKGAKQLHAYHSPRIIRLDHRDVLVGFTAYELMAHDARTGKLLWKDKQDYVRPSKRLPGNDEAHSNTVLYEDGSIYYSTTGAGKGGVKLELSENGRHVKELWRNAGFDGYMGGIVKIGDHLYGCGTENRGLLCIDASTGVIEQVLKVGIGAVIAADSMLYYYNHAGEVMLIALDQGNMEVKSRFKISKGDNQHFAHPVIHDGKLYIRHGNVIQAFRIRQAVSG